MFPCAPWKWFFSFQPHRNISTCHQSHPELSEGDGAGPSCVITKAGTSWVIFLPQVPQETALVIPDAAAVSQWQAQGWGGRDLSLLNKLSPVGINKALTNPARTPRGFYGSLNTVPRTRTSLCREQANQLGITSQIPFPVQ